MVPSARDGGNENKEINLQEVIFWLDNIVHHFKKFGVKSSFDLLSVDTVLMISSCWKLSLGLVMSLELSLLNIMLTLTFLISIADLNVMENCFVWRWL